MPHGENQAAKYQIAENSWNFESDTEAMFNIAYEARNIFLNFYVRESNVKANYTELNQPVYEDSCVEFFISFDRKNYYNLEFNYIGNILGGYGNKRENRTSLESKWLNPIKTVPSLGSDRLEIINRKTYWKLGVRIPLSVFVFDAIDDLTGLKAYCNFYKCGDKQVYPHFLSWSPITAKEPNFHLLDFFGEIDFV